MSDVNLSLKNSEKMKQTKQEFWWLTCIATSVIESGEYISQYKPFLRSVCFRSSSLPLIVVTAATELLSSMAAALNRIAQAAHSWRPEEARRFAEQAWQDPNPHHLLILLHLIWCRPRRLTTLQRLIKMVNLRFYRSYSTAASVSSKFRQICLLFILFFSFFELLTNLSIDK